MRIKLNLTQQCLECPLIDIREQTDRMYGGTEPIMVYGELTCSHFSICNKIDRKTQKTIDDLLYEGRD